MKSNTFIYVIHDNFSGRVKIGRSRDPYARLKALQTTCPTGLAISGFFEVGSYKAETEAHKFFEEYRLHGEWFDVSVDKAISEIKAIALKFPPNNNNEKNENDISEQDLFGFRWHQEKCCYEQLMSFTSRIFPEEVFSDALRLLANEAENETAVGVAVMTLFGMNKIVAATKYMEALLKSEAA